MAICELEDGHVPKAHILAIPLDKRKEPRRLFDSIHESDGLSFLDIAAVLATCGMLLGAVYGFVLKWGPVLWGAIGLVAGAALGIVVKWLLVRGRFTSSTRHRRETEVFLMVFCEEKDAPWITKTLWDHSALGVASYGAQWQDEGGQFEDVGLGTKAT